MEMLNEISKAMEALLDLDGLRYVIDEILGVWVKFEVKQVARSSKRPHGIKYSLTMLETEGY